MYVYYWGVLVFCIGFDDFINYCHKVLLFFRPDSVATIVKRALESIGRKGYNLIWKNCEHFATWCRYGKEISKQVNMQSR